MNSKLLKALVALLPAGILFAGSIVTFARWKAIGSLFQLVGAACFIVVVFAHVCEAVRILPWMNWGSENSAGHYLDLSSAILGGTLFPIGYLLHALRRQHPR